ncbi:MAG: hypothetical protein MJ173_05965, partial [Clostridia bacterium]|nr:hypothetical protein [Clostridia bacterium]
MKKRILSILLSILLCVSYMPVSVLAAYEDGATCEYCGEYRWDDYLCDNGSHCAVGSSCGNEHHCPSCEKCDDDVTICPECEEYCSDCAEGWCDDCGLCLECALDAGFHCPTCEKCSGEVEICPECEDYCNEC